MLVFLSLVVFGFRLIGAQQLDCLSDDEPFCASSPTELTFTCTLSTMKLNWVLTNGTMSVGEITYNQHSDLLVVEPIGPMSLFNAVLVVRDASPKTIQSNLTFTPLLEMDGLLIECYRMMNANNIHSCTITIADVPSAPLNVITTNYTNTSVLLSWSPPETSVNCVGTYTVTSDITNMTTVSNAVTLIVPENDPPSTMYCATVAAIDFANRTGNNSIETCFILDVPAPLEVNYKINGVNFLLKWNSSEQSIGRPPITMYYIQAILDAVTILITQLGSDSDSYEIADIPDGEILIVTIIASNLLGNNTGTNVTIGSSMTSTTTGVTTATTEITSSIMSSSPTTTTTATTTTTTAITTTTTMETSLTSTTFVSPTTNSPASMDTATTTTTTTTTPLVDTVTTTIIVSSMVITISDSSSISSIEPSTAISTTSPVSSTNTEYMTQPNSITQSTSLSTTMTSVTTPYSSVYSMVASTATTTTISETSSVSSTMISPTTTITTTATTTTTTAAITTTTTTTTTVDTGRTTTTTSSSSMIPTISDTSSISSTQTSTTSNTAVSTTSSVSSNNTQSSSSNIQTSSLSTSMNSVTSSDPQSSDTLPYSIIGGAVAGGLVILIVIIIVVFGVCLLGVKMKRRSKAYDITTLETEATHSKPYQDNSYSTIRTTTSNNDNSWTNEVVLPMDTMTKSQIPNEPLYDDTVISPLYDDTVVHRKTVEQATYQDPSSIQRTISSTGAVYTVPQTKAERNNSKSSQIQPGGMYADLSFINGNQNIGMNGNNRQQQQHGGGVIEPVIYSDIITQRS